MKNILSVIIFFMVFTTITNAQYSNYYNLNVNQNLNLNANINQNIKVSGTIFENKTITTIDYGALSLANAQREANRLESIKYADEQQRRISLEIASDPVKAYDYGYNRNFTIKGKDAKPYGFKKFSVGYIIPNSALFVPSGAGRFENVSYDGITTEIVFNGPIYVSQKVDLNIEKKQQETGGDSNQDYQYLRQNLNEKTSNYYTTISTNMSK